MSHYFQDSSRATIYDYSDPYPNSFQAPYWSLEESAASTSATPAIPLIDPFLLPNTSDCSAVMSAYPNVVSRRIAHTPSSSLTQTISRSGTPRSNDGSSAGPSTLQSPQPGVISIPQVSYDSFHQFPNNQSQVYWQPNPMIYPFPLMITYPQPLINVPSPLLTPMPPPLEDNTPVSITNSSSDLSVVIPAPLSVQLSRQPSTRRTRSNSKAASAMSSRTIQSQGKGSPIYSPQDESDANYGESSSKRRPGLKRRKSNQQPVSPQRECELPFDCKYCYWRFSRRRDRDRHERSLHTRETPYECKACGAAFVRTDARLRHWKSNSICMDFHMRIEGEE